MASFIIAVVLVGAIVGLATALALAQRQYDADEAAAARAERSGASRGRANGRPTSGPPPVPPAAYATSSLSTLIASTIEASGRLKARNSSEAAAVDALRVGLTKAVDGEFGAQVMTIIDRIRGIEVLHDVRRRVPGDDVFDRLFVGTEVDHLVVGPSGVFVIDTRVRSSKVSYSSDTVYSGRGDDRSRDSMVDEVARSMSAVAELIGTVPVHGVIVLADVLSLPDEIRAGPIEVGGVRLVTPSQLPGVLMESGPVSDLAVVAARLRTGFEPALPSTDDHLHLSLHDRPPSQADGNGRTSKSARSM